LQSGHIRPFLRKSLRVRLDLILAERRMTLSELAEQVGITLVNLSV
jgi:putative transcriptional regulator